MTPAALPALLAAVLLAAPVRAPRAEHDDAPSPRLLALALRAAERAHAEGRGTTNKLLTLVDYSRPSTEKRLWIIDLATRKVLDHEYVAHGRGSGDNVAKRFSNEAGSLASSLGLYETGDTYQGRHGLSLKLLGLEPGWNDRAEARDVVVHGAAYVSAEFAREHGRLGRSWGCPAVDERIAPRLIAKIKQGSLVLVYYPEPRWLKSSRFVK
jgi:hypothetical protein